MAKLGLALFLFSLFLFSLSLSAHGAVGTLGPVENEELYAFAEVTSAKSDHAWPYQMIVVNYERPCNSRVDRYVQNEKESQGLFELGVLLAVEKSGTCSGTVSEEHIFRLPNRPTIHVTLLRQRADVKMGHIYR